MMVSSTSRSRRWLVSNLLAVGLLVTTATIPAQATSGSNASHPNPVFSNAAVHDVSPPLTVLAANYRAPSEVEDEDVREERGEVAQDTGYTGDSAVQTAAPSVTIPSATSFEGLRNTDNPGTIRVNPPDPVGDVGPNNYVEMVNLVFAVYDKAGNRLLGPTPLGALWEDFPVTDCARLAGDPIVLHDQFMDRWVLSQFTSAGPEYWNCVAISTTGDPTGTYYRYAFSTGVNFPDYPKYGVWTDSYVITTREFGPEEDNPAYGIGVYALEKNKMVNGQDARAVSFFLDGNDPTVLPLVGDGLLPADIDGKQKPMTDAAIPLVGTQDDGSDYGGTFDALNIWDLTVKWRSTPVASLTLNAQLPVASFDSIFPCGVVPGSQPPSSRDCLPQPGITDGSQYLDILSYRQRPTWRLAYRNFKTYESLVTNQSVEALPGIAGSRWYEIRRDAAGAYSLYQQGTYAPNDGVHRWMGSIAQDKKGDAALGFSVVNAIDVYPGIRYTGRLAGDPMGQMTLGEGVIINGSGVQTNVNSRWGDYTSMNVDPVDDCTFWYVNEYYEVTEPPPDRLWQTRIAHFKLPGC